MKRKRPIEAYPRELIAVVGTDGEVIALGWPSGAQGGLSPLTKEEALQMRAYLDRFLAVIGSTSATISAEAPSAESSAGSAPNRPASSGPADP
jgi:hypothetical protein